MQYYVDNDVDAAHADRAWEERANERLNKECQAYAF